MAIDDTRRYITIFGSARVEPGSAEYEAARRLGGLLAEQGFVVATGGYNGVMEAISRGAKEAGGGTIGITVEIIARMREPNSWIDQEIRTAALLERIDKMVEVGAGYIVLPGGPGTLVELAAVWNLSLLGGLQDKPVVVVGEGWEHVLRSLPGRLHVSDRELGALTFAADVDAAVTILVERLGALV